MNIVSQRFLQYPTWLDNLVRQAKSAFMREAAYLYMQMYNRIELSRKNGWVTDGKIYINYRYAETQDLLGCGKTKCWKLYKLLKQLGLITVKYRGFGDPMMIFVHGAAVVDGDPNTPKFKEAVKQHKDISNGEFTEGQLRKIYAIADDMAPDLAEEDKADFLERLYYKMDDAEQAKQRRAEAPITDRFGYYLGMLKNAHFTKLSTYQKLELLRKSPNRPPPSSDWDEIFRRAKNCIPKLE